VPAAVVKSFARRFNRPVAEVEKLWARLTSQYGDNDAAVVVHLKKLLRKQSESRVKFVGWKDGRR